MVIRLPVVVQAIQPAWMRPENHPVFTFPFKSNNQLTRSLIKAILSQQYLISDFITVTGFVTVGPQCSQGVKMDKILPQHKFSSPTVV